jgi:hypothetical protein
VQAEFRQRVLGEIRTAHRTVDKLREKNVQRYLRHTRQAQDRRAREKAQAAKTAKDAVALCKVASDKVVSKFQRDTKAWVTGLNDKFEAGKVLFQNSLEVSQGGAFAKCSESSAFDAVHVYQWVLRVLSLCCACNTPYYYAVTCTMPPQLKADEFSL